jgi:ketosteroid isomerase-like protein
VPTSRGEKEESVAEALIRQRVEDYAKAISAKDIDSVMSFFAPNLVSFDIAIKTPRYVGADNNVENGKQPSLRIALLPTRYAT